MTDEPEITVQKIGGWATFSAESTYGSAAIPSPWAWMNRPEPTTEERAEWARQAEERKQRASEYAAQIDTISDPVARMVLDLHARDEARYGTRDLGCCEGCDVDGYEGEQPSWPCRTVVLIGNHFGIEESA